MPQNIPLRSVVSYTTSSYVTASGERQTVFHYTLDCGHVVQRTNQRPKRCYCGECQPLRPMGGKEP